jgi:hypothetical protein
MCDDNRANPCRKFAIFTRIDDSGFYCVSGALQEKADHEAGTAGEISRGFFDYDCCRIEFAN